MSHQHDIAYQQPRRKDRAQDAAWIRELLTRSPIGVLATVGDGVPALNPNLFVFDASRDAIYLHTAKTGTTRDNVEERPRVAFCVAEMGRLLPADAAVHFSVEYASVVLTGTSTVVEDADEAARALDLLMRKYAPQFAPGRDYRVIEGKDLARTSVFRIDIESWTGKGKTSEAADAYAYQAASTGAREKDGLPSPPTIAEARPAQRTSTNRAAALLSAAIRS